jgi:hypothetical protein
MAWRTAARIAQVIEQTSLFDVRNSRSFSAENRPKVARLENLDSHMISMS